jgi:hypothetical protein
LEAFVALAGMYVLVCMSGIAGCCGAVSVLFAVEAILITKPFRFVHVLRSGR